MAEKKLDIEICRSGIVGTMLADVVGKEFDIFPIETGGSAREFIKVKGSREKSLVVLYDPDSRRLSKYVSTALYLKECGVATPEIRGYFWEYKLCVMEDIGDVNLQSAVVSASSEKRLQLYRTAIDMLLYIQSAPFRKKTPVIIAKEQFDRQRLNDESQQFIKHLVIGKMGLSDFDSDELTLEREMLADTIDSFPKVLMHRDFQSQNIFIKKDMLRVVDFQDAAMGPFPYDLAALLWDPYAMLPDDEIDELIEHYYDRLYLFGFLDYIPRKEFDRMLHLSAISRLLQAAGAFARLEAAGKKGFAKYIAPAIKRLDTLLRDGDFPFIAALVAKVVGRGKGEKDG